MKPSVSMRILGALAGACAAAGAIRAQTASEIIAKARHYLGGDAKLAAIHSIHYVGTMQSHEHTAAGPQSITAAIEIILQKPFQQRITLTTAKQIETTGLDDLQAWQRIEEVADRSRQQLKILVPDAIKRLRANTWENLNFYKGLRARYGEVKVLGPATVDGVATVEVAFIHGPGIVFYRYFDPTDGRLVLTETPQGGKIREEGRMMVDGVRFPRKIVTTTEVRDAQGRPVKNSIVVSFTKITLNETFPDRVFAVPPVPPPREPRMGPAASPSS